MTRTAASEDYHLYSGEEYMKETHYPLPGISGK